jgi:conjugal transfer pilus assembly protein TraB
MSLREQVIKSLRDLKETYFSWIDERLLKFFHYETERRVKWSQRFFLLFLGILLIIPAILLAPIFFEEKLPSHLDKAKKLTPTPIETTSNKVDLNEMWRHKTEEDIEKFKDELLSLKDLFQEKLKENQEFDLPSLSLTEIEEKLSRLESRFENKGESEASILPLQVSTDSEEHLIYRFSFNLQDQTEEKLKTPDTTIPAGAFARSVLLSGIDGSSAMSASSDPRPMLLRVIDHGTLPRRFQSDLMDCHLIAGAYGDLSSERVYARLEKLTCVDKETTEIFESKVSGYIAGGDGKAGIRGLVVSKEGQFLSRSLIGGILGGLSAMSNPQNNRTQTPFLIATPGTQSLPPSTKPMGSMLAENFATGMSQGVSTAMDRLSQYYIDRAEQLQPVIQVAAGQVVDIVFTEGTELRSSDQNSSIALKQKKNQEKIKENQQ